MCFSFYSFHVVDNIRIRKIEMRHVLECDSIFSRFCNYLHIIFPFLLQVFLFYIIFSLFPFSSSPCLLNSQFSVLLLILDEEKTLYERALAKLDLAYKFSRKLTRFYQTENCLRKCIYIVHKFVISVRN